MALIVKFKIEKGIPIPPPRADELWEGKGFSKGYAKALRLLEVGDSVWLPTHLQSVNTTCKRIRGETGHQFTIRTEGEGVRAWRIK